MSLDQSGFGVAENTWLPDVSRDYSRDANQSPMAIHKKTKSAVGGPRDKKKKKGKKKGSNLAAAKALMKDPENAQCADCEGKHLRAADTMWGVWLCRECAKAHVTDLPGLNNVVDAFDGELTDAQLALMQCMTNVKANKMYEAIIAEKPGRKKQHCSERFIKDKYKYKFFWNPQRKDWTPTTHFASQIKSASRKSSPSKTPSKSKSKQLQSPQQPREQKQVQQRQVQVQVPVQAAVQQTDDLFAAFGLGDNTSTSSASVPANNNGDIMNDLFGMSGNGNSGQSTLPTSSSGGADIMGLFNTAPQQQQLQQQRSTGGSAVDIMGMFGNSSSAAPAQQSNNGFGNMMGQGSNSSASPSKSRSKGDIMGLFDTSANANKIDLAFSNPAMGQQQFHQQQQHSGLMGMNQQLQGNGLMGMNNQHDNQQNNNDQWGGLGF